MERTWQPDGKADWQLHARHDARPDHRTRELSRFHRACRIASIVCALGALSYLAGAVVPVLTQPPATGSESLDRALLGYELVLHLLALLQITGCALLAHGLARTTTVPFTAWNSRCLAALGAAFLLKGAIVPLLMRAFAAQHFFFNVAASDLRLGRLFIASLDIPSLLFALLLFVLAALFRYGRELYVDSEEML